MYGDAELTAIQKMRDTGNLSQRTLWDEYSRRGVLGPSFDADAEEEALLKEVPADDGLDEDTLPPG